MTYTDSKPGFVIGKTRASMKGQGVLHDRRVFTKSLNNLVVSQNFIMLKNILVRVEVILLHLKD